MSNKESKLDEMIKGYLDGLNSDFDSLSMIDITTRSAAYKHGWKNGRDDRLGEPRDIAAVLRARAEMILRN